MTITSQKHLLEFLRGILYSYSQVFFSKNIVFAIILIVVTFFDWLAGLAGLLSVVFVNGAAILMGYNTKNVNQGYYGFNSLLVGLGLGIYYQPGFAFFFLLVFAAIFTFFLTIWLENHFGKYGLPYLAWPFLLGIWMVSLAARKFTALELSDRGLYMINDMYDYGGTFMVDVYHWIHNLPIHESILIYFQSLGAIFFQYHLLAGVLIAVGLLIYSRIAFLLSLVGFFSAYFYYFFIGANFGELSYDYIGFNYILTAIAIGGFFFIPSKYSFLWVLLLTPIISIIISSTNVFFYNLQLSIYSLAFNVIVVLFVYVMKFRERYFTRPELVVVQQYSPEKNLYTQENYKNRFDIIGQQKQIHLPFWGEWIVTQAHDGEYTHKKDWKHAWDFEMQDEDKKYRNKGYAPEDYFCFNQPVIAPADGIVQEILDGVDDNPIGKVNLEKNWGNSIVIKHGDKLYTKLSHLKKDSITVKKGDEVKRGSLLAKVGNSGRSPYPHLHFQIQKNPCIGSKTLDYPIAEYVVKNGNKYELKTYDRPLKDQCVERVAKNDSLYKAFNFIPGQVIYFEFKTNDGELQKEEWEVKTDIFNNTFLSCENTSSVAWFKNEGKMFYFTQFTGDDNSLLYYFYLGAYKVALGYYQDMVVEDRFPLAILKNNFKRFLQDFVAPFHIFMKADFMIKYVKMIDDLSTSNILLRSEANLKFSGKRSSSMHFEIFIDEDRIKRFDVRSDQININAAEIKS